VARRWEDASLIPVGGAGTVAAVHRPASCRLAEKDGGHGAMPSSGVSDDARRGELNGVNLGRDLCRRPRREKIREIEDQSLSLTSIYLISPDFTLPQEI
jgi:hypothetical protein